MNTKTKTKVTALFLAFMMLFANVSYAGSAILEEQSKAVNKAKIEFDVYFQNKEKEVTHYKDLEVGEEETLNLSIKVEEGYLTNANVKIEDANFKVLDTNKQFDIIQSISSDKNKIELNQIRKDESVVLKVPIEINADSSFSVEDLSKQAKITLEGTYVNNKGKEVKITKSINVETAIDGTAESLISQEVVKYVPFNVNGEKGVILQTLVKSKLVDNKLPVKTTKLEIEIPSLSKIEPEKIILTSKGTMATNGLQGKTYSEEEYKIEDGKIILEIQNDKSKLSWNKNVEDEIILTCVYNEKAVADKQELNLNAKSEITYYAKETKTAKQESKQKLELTEKVGELVTAKVNTSEETLYKGHMLAQAGKNTEFVTNLELNIGYNELVDKIVFKDEVSYVDENQNSYPSNALYTYTKISKENLLEVLGEDGYINIYNEANKKIAELNKDNLEVKYETETKGLIFETSKPITVGILKIENGRGIKPLEYSKAQVQMFKTFKINLNAKLLKDEKQIISTSEVKEIALENPTSQAEIQISNPNLSTIVKNEGIELRVVLKTTDAKAALYKNPKIEITLPKYITNIDVNNVKLVYDKELKIVNAQKGKNKNGNIVIKIDFAGEQTKYNAEWITEGSTIILETNMEVNALTPTRTEKALLTVTNENTEGKVEQSADINFIAPTGVETVSQITNFGKQDVVTIGAKRGVGEIPVNGGAKTGVVKIAAINNYLYNLENVVILGRTPFAGNKGISDGKDLGSTFTAKVMSDIMLDTGITSNDIQVYYSSNGEATRDLNDINNTWVIDRNLLSEVKSYMIVLDGHKFNTGDVLGFSYQIEIPANLARNENTFGTFAIYYEREKIVEENGTSKITANPMQVAEGGICGVSTGTGPELKVELKSDLEEGTKITSRKTANFEVNVKNDGILTAENVTVKVDLPQNISGIIYNETAKTNIVDTTSREVNIVIPKIEAGETGNTNFKLQMRPYSENDIQEKGVQEGRVGIKAEATVQGYEDKFTSNETSYVMSREDNKETEITMSVTAVPSIVSTGDGVQYLVEVTHNASNALNNVQIKCKMPQGLKFKSTDKNGIYDESTDTITWNFEKLNSELLAIYVDVEEIEDGIYEKDIPIVLTATCAESSETFTNKVHNIQIRKQGYSISQLSSISEGEIKAGQEIIYAITVKNIGSKIAPFTIKDVLPKELEFVNYSYNKNGDIITVDEIAGNTITISPTLGIGDTLVIYVTAIARAIDTSKEIANKVTLYSEEISEIEANEVVHTLVGTSSGNQPGDNIPNEERKKYTISGVAWVDADKNGRRDTGEEFLPNINVYLLNSTNRKIVRETKTNDNGVYNFQDVEQGNYLVAFEYDTEKYELTTYQADGVDESNNSDTIKIDMKLKDKIQSYAVTNTIALNNNKYNIDLGLLDNPKFDLEMTKGIDLIQVSNSQGTKSYTYDHADIAKVEIPEKYMEGSVIAITYSFRITNTGAVSGYVNKVVDYKSKDLTFSTSLNPEWNLENDGSIYTNITAGEEIKPGETLEFPLILTKTMTKENTGISSNIAEIAEVTNDLGLDDIDSTPGNRNTGEDDLGTADIIVAVKTGGILIGGGIVLIIIAIFAFGAYEINKRVLRRI